MAARSPTRRARRRAHAAGWETNRPQPARRAPLLPCPAQRVSFRSSKLVCLRCSVRGFPRKKPPLLLLVDRIHLLSAARSARMQLSLGKLAALAVFIAAATLEVVGDALIRKGMRGGGLALVGLGFMLLGTYGVLVNLIDLNFSK